mmetsp:Transcript_11813/g.16924  ORF Transcript_11813/g.16924 Transcript_11813/m.16924 type:complete len:182 (-) Transcript_11813:9-554(-)
MRLQDNPGRDVAPRADPEAAEVWIEIERCIGCEHHSFCTQHSELKYDRYEEKIRAAIDIVAGGGTVLIKVNPGPASLPHDAFSLELPLAKFYPRLGAFEVHACKGRRRIEVFSKIGTRRWPNPHWFALRLEKAVAQLGGWYSASSGEPAMHSGREAPAASVPAIGSSVKAAKEVNFRRSQL